MVKRSAYHAKREFQKTPEPRGRTAKAQGFTIVVQKHDATRLHYDFRLELDGVLKSWAVTKGPSLTPGEKRLAVHVEDHPLDYGAFEGTIPKGQYGGGTVLLWDRGVWEPEGDPRKGYAKGHLRFRLHGEKLRGGWHLVRMRRRPKERQEQWLLIKSEDEWARSERDPDILDEAPLSVKTGRSLKEIAVDAKSALWTSKAGGEKVAKPARANRPRANAQPALARKGETAPMPDSVAPCLATPADAVPNGEGWLHEIKWDGYRLIAAIRNGELKLTTRNGHDWTKRFPAIATALAALPVETAILDGEAVVEDETGISSFSALQDALSDGRAADKAVFYAFDLLYRNGSDLRRLPLDERKGALAALTSSEQSMGVLRFSEHIEADGDTVVRHACRLGLEGVISKRRDRPYRSGRVEDWLKIKCTNRQEFVIAGFTPSSALRDAVGSLILGAYEAGRLAHVGRTGTGFTGASARELWKRLKALRINAPPFERPLNALQRRDAVWVRPELVAEVEFRGWTADHHLRHAAFKGLREDKDAREVAQEEPTAALKRGRSSAREETRVSASGEVEVAGVPLTHPDRILWEEQGVTKQGLAEYYEAVADWILPHVVHRPLALVRCPTGSQKGCFFQKHSWAGLSDFIRRETVRDEGGEEEVLLVEDTRGVIALVQAGVLEIHPWGARIDDVEHPDRIVMDLDPGEGVAWPGVIEGARELRERLKALGLESFVKTTSGKGLHVVLPIAPAADWKTVKAFAKDLADAMERDNPQTYVVTSVKKARTGRIYVDYLRNGRGATAVAAYSTRARPGAPVSTPLAWDELSPAVKPNHFNVSNVPARLERLRHDPWAEVFQIKQTLPSAKGARTKRK